MSGQLLDIQAPRAASTSKDGLYRYWLHRRWAAHGTEALFIMLNPSTADALVDDPTIRRCVGFAKAWGHALLTVVNLYAYRATKPVDLWKAADPVGPDNDADIAAACCRVGLTGGVIVAAWGALTISPDRAKAVLEIATRYAPVMALRITAAGHPGHPLYIPGSQPLELYVSKAAS